VVFLHPETGNPVEPQKVEGKTLDVFKNEFDLALEIKVFKGYGGKMGPKLLSLMISLDHNEWRTRLEGPNNLLQFLFSIFPQSLEL